MSIRATFAAQPRAFPKKEKHGVKKTTQPSSIFAHLEYQKRGVTTLPDNYKKVVSYVEKCFEVPKDFEISASYGVHSGSCYERRLIAAFVWGQLLPKPGVVPQKMCVECGQKGHFRDECEDLLRQ